MIYKSMQYNIMMKRIRNFLLLLLVR